MTNLTAEGRDTIYKVGSALFQRLVLVDCRKEAVVALRADGEDAVADGFQTLGKRASTQLLSDPAAKIEMQKLFQYLDRPKWGDLFKEGAAK